MQAAKPDRLSALIRQFRIKAIVHPTGVKEDGYVGDGRAPPNLFVVRSGELRFSGPACEAMTCSGSKLVFFPRGMPSGMQAQPSSPDTEYLRATIDMGGEANPIAQALPPLFHIPLGETASLGAVADLLLEEALSPRCGGGAVIDRLCEVVVIRLLRHAIEAGQAEPGLLAGLAHPNLCLAIVAIHESPDRNWRLEDLAEVAGMSRTHFANTFRKTVGVTPGEYLSGWRLTMARAEVAKGVPLKIIAGRVGFSGSAALSRAFSRRFGYSPRADYKQGQRQPATA